ncbi:MAG: arginine--tRNA ligase, partial [Thermodesulfobacteriota bacterium]
MIRAQIEKLLAECCQDAVADGVLAPVPADLIRLEIPKLAAHGDFATNLAMVAAGREKKKPRPLAEELARRLAQRQDLLARVEIAGPGFINLFVAPSVWQGMVPAVLAAGESFGLSAAGAGRTVLVEFVSANPTGPLSVGHGRQAVLGDAIARLLAATGHAVTREYYYNDGGRQMRVLGESTRARYLEILGLPHVFPEDGYQGDYIREIAQALKDEHGDRLKDVAAVAPFTAKAEEVIFADIKGTLARLGIVFDSFFNEHTLYEDGKLDEVLGALREQGLIYEQEGAVWLRATSFGLDKDRVLVKSSGEPTYRLPDIAYHREKFRRGFDWMVNVFGSDHIATVPDVLAGVKALGFDPAKVTPVIHQFVTLLRDGKQVKMSTRKATFVTVDELLDEVG